MPIPVWLVVTAKKVVPFIPGIAKEVTGAIKNRPRRTDPHADLSERLRRLENKVDSIDRRLARVEGKLGIHLPESH